MALRNLLDRLQAVGKYCARMKSAPVGGHSHIVLVAHPYIEQRPHCMRVEFRARQGGYTAPAFCAYSHDAFDSGRVRLADSMALALAAVPSRMRPAMPCVMPASRNRLYEKYQFRSGTALPVTLQ